MRVHQSPAKVEEAIEAAIELAKLESVADYIKSQPKERQDTATLSKMMGPIDLYQQRMEQVDKLEKELTDISAKFQIEKAAQDAGAINSEVVAMVHDKLGGLEHSIDVNGNVQIFVNGQTIRDTVKLMASKHDTAHLFGSSKVGGNEGGAETTRLKAYAGVNPWAKDTMNLTGQGKLIRQNPDAAGRFIIDAGKDPKIYGL